MSASAPAPTQDAPHRARTHMFEFEGAPYPTYLILVGTTNVLFQSTEIRTLVQQICASA